MTPAQHRAIARLEKNVCVALDVLNDAAARADKRDPESLAVLIRAIWRYSAAELAPTGEGTT